uniref:TIR domain-containing protein n=1 Tax=Macrostomum lignano TaxID=282301 RepID=A0A1I8FBS1_9PLAT
DAQGLDFSGQPVADSLDELGSAIVAPERTHPAVVLEQSYVRKLARKLPPAGYLAHTSAGTTLQSNMATLPNFFAAPARSLDSAASSSQSQQPDPASPGFIRTRTGTQLSLAPSVPSQQHQQPAVFISYHWDSTEAVLELKRFLIAHAIRVQLDTDKSPDEIMKGVRDDGSRKVFIEKAMRDCHCVLLAVTPKYLRSENCQSDIEAAYRQRRPLLPVLLTFCAWPPDSSCAAGLRKRLAAIPAIDIGSERLAKKNLARLVQRVQQISGPP